MCGCGPDESEAGSGAADRADGAEAFDVEQIKQLKARYFRIRDTKVLDCSRTCSPKSASTSCHLTRRNHRRGTPSTSLGPLLLSETA